MSASYACRICGHHGNETAYVMQERMFGLGDSFRYFSCDQCGCLQIAEVPANMGRYYPAGYYSFGTSSRDLPATTIVRYLRGRRNFYSVFPEGAAGRFVQALFANRKLTCLAGLHLSLASRILDVGCGAGWRLYALREAGFRHTLGIDPFLSKEELVHDNGVRVIRKGLQEMDGTWDLVMFHHSFEHLPDPAESLRTAANLLCDQGTCLIRLPVVDSFAWEQYRENWYQIDAPRHYFLHSCKSIAILADMAGMNVYRVVFDSTIDQFWRSEAIMRGDHQADGPGWWKKRALKVAADRLNREGKGDQAAFYLRKGPGPSSVLQAKP